MSTSNQTTTATPAWSPYAREGDFDVLVKGGTVIDPDQGINAPRDVGTRHGKIAAIAEDLPAGSAVRVVDARGKIVTPGFIDLHVHAFDGVTLGLDADHYCLSRGTTTCVDAGSMGHLFLNRFVRDIVATSVTRVYTLAHIDPMGPTTGLRFAQDNLDWLDPTMTARAALANRPAVVGIKVHLSKSKSRDPEAKEKAFLDRAIEAAELAGLPVMVHLNDTYYPLKDHLARFRSGDIFTHVFNDFEQTRPYGADGRVLPEMIDARSRGVVFDTAIGFEHPHFTFEVAERCIEQGFLPDTISSGNDRKHVFTDVIDLPTTVSKFLAIGVPLEKAIELVTAAPARVFDYGVQIGTLRPGSEADIAIFELQRGEFEYIDGVGGKRVGHERLVSRAVIARGRPYVNSVG